MFEWYIEREKLGRNISLCASCENAQLTKGRWASEKIAICTVRPGTVLTVPFVVLECSRYCPRVVCEVIQNRVVTGFAP
jgi:hypothetical protein